MTGSLDRLRPPSLDQREGEQDQHERPHLHALASEGAEVGERGPGEGEDRGVDDAEQHVGTAERDRHDVAQALAGEHEEHDEERGLQRGQHGAGLTGLEHGRTEQHREGGVRVLQR